MAVTCLFCDKDVSNDYGKYGAQYKPKQHTYICARCGMTRLTHKAAADFP